MTTIEALKHIADVYEISSMYALAKSLSDDEVKVQPIQIARYLKGKKPSKKVAQRFLDVYDIILTDVHNPGNLSPTEFRKIMEE